MKWKLVIEGIHEKSLSVAGTSRVSIDPKDMAENFISLLRRAGNCVTSASYTNDSGSDSDVSPAKTAIASLSPEVLSRLLGLPESMKIHDVRMSNTSIDGPAIMMRVEGTDLPDGAGIVLSYRQGRDGTYSLAGIRETSW